MGPQYYDLEISPWDAHRLLQRMGNGASGDDFGFLYFYDDRGFGPYFCLSPGCALGLVIWTGAGCPVTWIWKRHGRARC